MGNEDLRERRSAEEIKKHKDLERELREDDGEEEGE